jgi:hypothetical protein
MKRIAAVAVVLAGVAPAAAQSFYTGDDLLRFCSADAGSPEDTTCASYIAGILDGIVHYQDAKFAARSICLPADSYLSFYRDIVVRHIREDEKNRPLSASSLIWNAMRRAFPCSAEGAKPPTRDLSHPMSLPAPLAAWSAPCRTDPSEAGWCGVWFSAAVPVGTECSCGGRKGVTENP